MATPPNIRIDIASTFKDRGFKQAQRQSSLLDKSFKRLASTFLTVFSVGAITRFGKASVRAFADAEREAAQLRTALKSLNLEFASPLMNQYMDSLELATGRAGSDLTNAFVSLSAATQDVTTAQSLLNTAMDISAATGKDLQTVSVALQRAYKGEVTALARLRIGLTTAELKGKDFDSVLGQLRDRFTGAQAAAADTYAGKIARLGQATEQAREKVGEGFVKGLEDAGVSVVEFQRQIIALGESTGRVAASFTGFGSNVAGVFQGLANNSALQFVVNAVDRMTQVLGFVPGQLQGLQLIPNDRTQRAAETKRIEALRDQVKATNNLAKIEQKNIKARTAAEKKSLSESQKLKRAGTVFDMENIQLVAAMQGEIDAQERLRLTALLAINTKNAEAAEASSKAVLMLNAGSLAALNVMIKASDSVDDVINKLLVSQARIALVALGITDLPKAKNPFEDWDAIIKKILADLAAIQAGLQFSTSINGQAQKTPPTTVPSVTQPSVVAPATPVIVTPGGAANVFTDFPWDPLTEFPTAPPMPTITPELLQAINASGLDNPWTVNVYVQGSVTTEADLTKTIIDNIYDYQGFGGSITYNLATI